MASTRKTTRKQTPRGKATARKATRAKAVGKGRRRTAWKPKFLSALAFDCNVRRSAEVAATTRATAYRERERDPEFAEAWDAALQGGYDRLEQEAHRRAVEGVEEPVIRRGQLGYWADAEGNQVTEDTEGAVFLPLTIRRYSDHILLALLKAHRPEKFRERYEVRHAGDDQNVDAEIRQLAADLERLAAGQLPKE